MMTTTQPVALRRIATFVVRLWTEPTAGLDVVWRGQIEHVQSGDRRGFVEMRFIEEFVADHLRQAQDMPVN